MIDIYGYGHRLVAAMRSVVADQPVGLYLHGSVALGGFRPERSDVDVLAVISAPLTPDAQVAVGEALLAVAYPCPGTGLEASVITAATAADLADCHFEVHVATPDTVTIGTGRAGDPDLVLYAEVCRRSAITVAGPPAASVFGVVPSDRVRDAIDAELDWGLANASFEYAILNACRAMRYGYDGSLVSKVAGGEWYLAENPSDAARPADALVSAALSRQRGVNVAEPTHDGVAAFIRSAQEMLRIRGAGT
ncbi:MAG TPA: aminoglycoside adenylyltransferase domain-containing protein [Micromonosporaceae bacterium]|jgi:streptomycin 3"-adenylyltransferase